MSLFGADHLESGADPGGPGTPSSHPLPFLRNLSLPPPRILPPFWNSWICPWQCKINIVVIVAVATAWLRDSLVCSGCGQSLWDTSRGHPYSKGTYNYNVACMTLYEPCSEVVVGGTMQWSGCGWGVKWISAQCVLASRGRSRKF